MTKTILLTVLSFFTFICYSQTKETKIGLLSDLKIYREIIETSHTGMYLYTPKPVFDTLFKKLKSDIKSEKVKTDKDFFLAISRIHTKMNCGHSNIFTPHSFISDITKNQKAFLPLKVKFIKDTLIIASDFKGLKKGTQIIKINNKSIKDICTDAFQIITSDGYNTTNKYRQLEDEFSEYYFLLYGIHKTYNLKVIPYLSENSHKITISGISYPETNFNNKEDDTPNIKYIDKNTALLTVNTFSTETEKNQKKFFDFLKHSFSDIKTKGIKNLIIDVRRNSGGDDGNDIELASYIINKHFKEDKYRKLNAFDLPLYPEYLHEKWKYMMGLPKDVASKTIKSRAKKMINEEFYKGKDGAYYYKEKYLLKREPKKNLFSGNIYILISGRVFSGGSVFCALVRDKSNAIFVGEETGGGYYRHTGTIPLIYELPNSKIAFCISIVVNEQDVDQKLYPNGRGIIPQIKIHQTIKDFVDDRDTALNYIKEVLTK